ncbi:DNA ligase 4 isoform X2 [Calliopsis andreniformis]|uniref:DNA ligase 4 isoform X2 n=1 Tax=Calliopsis andreniformis TaxID=337506 RepID=UPI003FCD67C1
MTLTLASKIEFKRLCKVLEEVTKVQGEKKTEILRKFIQACRNISQKIKTELPDADVSLFPILRLILPHLERERGPSNLKEKSLANLYVRVFCLGKNSKDAINLVQYKTPIAKKIAGSDFAAKAYSILQNRLPRDSSDFSVERINLFLDSISSPDETGQEKDKTFSVLLEKINALEFKWITRIILKDLKLGIGTKKILDVFHRDANKLFDVSSNLRHVCDTLYDPQLRYQHNITVFSHFKPMLLERCKIEDAEKLFSKGEQYFVQCKYDGERSQMHMKDGKYKYFTRQGYDITNNPGYGETSSSGFMSSVFNRLLNSECKSIILDGELMGWHKEKKLMGSKGMNYDVKKLSENSHHQPCFVAFDVLLYNDVLLDNESYEERLKILKKAFKEEEGCLMLCKSSNVSNSVEVCSAFNESMKNKEEGIVLKRCDAIYRPNVRDGSGCYKIKAEFSDDLVEDVDLLILGGYYGEGRFMGLIKSFLMGVASSANIPGENPSKFMSVVSLDKPPLWVRPEESIIVTVRASEMTRSNDYPTGYSLRFPRVMRVRDDKPWYAVCTETELLSLIKDTRPIQKLTKREVDYDDIEDAPEPKVSRTKRRSINSTENVTSSIYDNPPIYISRLLYGKEICVINGNDELPKEQIEQTLLQHRARVVQNPLKDNYCIILGNIRTARANNIIQSKMYDVVTVDWFKRVIKEENWSSLQDFLPWDLICCRESTKQRLEQHYDEFYDHYTTDADEESLGRSFKKVEETANTIEIDRAQMKELDAELFGNRISPYSIFRDIVGYFNDESDSSKYKFRFMTGTIKETIDDTVTHVFVKDNSINIELRTSILKLQPSLAVVKSEWIMECFRKNELIPVTEYLLQ